MARSWIRFTNDRIGVDSIRLLCFPYAGGTASVFRHWHSCLAPGIEIYGIQLPGRANRICEPLLTNLLEAASVLCGELQPLFARPFMLFGHSVGALLAFEIARLLQADLGVTPLRLFVSARRAPQIPDTDPPNYKKSDKDFMTALRELRGTPEEIWRQPELLNLTLPAIRADFEMAETYNYIERPPLLCPITAFAGTNDEETGDGKVEGWRIQTAKSFSVHLLNGTHFFLHECERQLLSGIESHIFEDGLQQPWL